MRIDLICSDNIKGILFEFLSSRGFVIDDSSDVTVIESGYDIPKGKIALVFDMQNIARLVELIDMFPKECDEIIDSILGKSEDSYEIIPINQVFFFESSGNNTFGITGTGKFRVKEKLYELEKRLPKNRFIRVNKSFIVNIKSVKEIIPWVGRRLILKFNDCNADVEVSKNYLKNFKEFIGM